MSYSKYCELIDGFCQLTGLADPEQYHGTAEINVDDIDFVLSHGGEHHPDSFLIFANFGTPPDDLLPVVLPRLLEVNLSLFVPGGPRFGINPLMNEVILANVVPMKGVTAKHMLTMLQVIAKFATEWREHYFLAPAADVKAPGASIDSTMSKPGRA